MYIEGDAVTFPAVKLILLFDAPIIEGSALYDIETSGAVSSVTSTSNEEINVSPLELP